MARLPFHLDCLFKDLRHWCPDSPVLHSFMWACSHHQDHQDGLMRRLSHNHELLDGSLLHSFMWGQPHHPDSLIQRLRRIHHVLDGPLWRSFMSDEPRHLDGPFRGLRPSTICSHFSVTERFSRFANCLQPFGRQRSHPHGQTCDSVSLHWICKNKTKQCNFCTSKEAMLFLHWNCNFYSAGESMCKGCTVLVIFGRILELCILCTGIVKRSSAKQNGCSGHLLVAGALFHVRRTSPLLWSQAHSQFSQRVAVAIRATLTTSMVSGGD